MIKSVNRTLRLSSGTLKIFPSAFSICSFLLLFDQNGLPARFFNRFFGVSAEPMRPDHKFLIQLSAAQNLQAVSQTINEPILKKPIERHFRNLQANQLIKI